MKKIFLLILVSFVPLFLPRGVIHAAPQTVIVSEMVPGSRCVCMWETAPDGKTCASTVPVAERKYTCIVSSGLGGFQEILATIIRWLINIVLLTGVLAIIGLGIAWSIAGGDDAATKTSLKKWGINILIGLTILFFFRPILKLLAPWIYQ